MYDLQDYDTCIACGSRDAAVLASQEQLTAQKRFGRDLFRAKLPADTPDHMLDDIIFFANDYDARLVVCNNCGLVTRDPRFCPETSIQAYEQDDYHQEWLESAFRQYREAYREAMTELVRKFGKRLHVLEVGSYVGGFLAAAEGVGWRAQGVDVGKRVSEFARAQGLDVFTGALHRALYPAHAFDAVFVWVCFDQLPEPWEELAEIRRVLKPSGWLVLKVPNGDFAKRVFPLARKHKRLSKLVTYSGLAGFPYQFGHTPSTMRKMLVKSGFGQIEIRNQVNVGGKRSRGSRWQIPEQIRYLRFIHAISQIVYYATWRTHNIGPWIEITARKR